MTRGRHSQTLLTRSKGWTVSSTPSPAPSAQASLATVFTEGPSHFVRHTNGAFEVLSRRSPEELVDRAFASVLRAEPIEMLLDRVFETGIPDVACDVEWSAESDETVRYLTVIARPLASEDTGGRGLLVELLDTTAQALARASERRITLDSQLANEALVLAGLREQQAAEAAVRDKERWNALMENLVEGVTVLAGDGTAMLVNPVGRDLLGLDDLCLDTCPGCTFETLAGALVPPERHPAARAVAGERFRDEEYVYVRADASRAHLVFNGSSIRDDAGEVVLAINTYRDVTALRRLEESREEYVALISHDLRNPLQTLLGYIELLTDSLNRGGSRGGPEVQLKYVETLSRVGHRLAAMVEELYQSSKLEAGAAPMSFTPASPGSLLDELLEHVVPNERDRISIEAIPPDLPFVNVSVARIERALVNLVTNALKYSQPASTVVVSVERAGADVVFVVRDEGPGIGAEDLPHVFDKYRRGKVTAHRDGLGLGLYITRRIVDAHGGRIWAESASGRGSTFRIALPAFIRA